MPSAGEVVLIGREDFCVFNVKHSAENAHVHYSSR